MVEHLPEPPPVAVFAALGDPVRCELVRALRAGPATVSELAGRFPISLQAVSRHIGVLEAAGILRRERTGRSRVVTLERGSLRRAAAWLAPGAPADAYGRLDDFLTARGRSDAPPIRIVAGAPASTTITANAPPKETP